MKYRIITEPDEITIITGNGGIVCVREAESIDTEPREAVTDYYHMKLTEIDTTNDIWEELAEGTIYCNDWETAKFNSDEVVKDALNWLVPNETEFTRDDSLFTNLL